MFEATGGHFDAGVVRGVAVTTLGEAAANVSFWIDRTFLREVCGTINAPAAGIAVRLGHPAIDDIENEETVAELHDARIVGDAVLADLHFLDYAAENPCGNLAELLGGIMLASPSAMGLSLRFAQDLDRMAAFLDEHTINGEFQSPDPRNIDGLPHARLKWLHAVDLVDEPAANPNGIFPARSAASVERASERIGQDLTVGPVRIHQLANGGCTIDIF